MNGNYPLNCVIAMGETVDTVNATETKDIPLKLTGNEKVRVTVCFTTKADETKMKPFADFQGAKQEVAALNLNLYTFA